MRKVITLILISSVSFGVMAEISQEAKDAVTRNLKDPSSVQFRDTTTIKNSKNEQSHCGEFNAKNSYGGYVGFKRFSYSNGILTVVDNENNTLDDLIDYAASGCGGEQKEVIARNPKISLDSCLLSWQQIEDVTINNKSKDEAINSAIEVMKSKNNDISDSQVTLLKNQFSSAIDQTLNFPGTVQAIKENPKSFKENFVERCDSDTRRYLLSN